MAMSAEQWGAWFRQPFGREPTFEEYQQALAAGHVAPPPAAERAPSWRDRLTPQQLADAGKRVAGDAKGVFDRRIAPAAQSAAESVRRAVRERTEPDEQTHSPPSPTPGAAPTAAPSPQAATAPADSPHEPPVDPAATAPVPPTSSA